MSSAALRSPVFASDRHRDSAGAVYVPSAGEAWNSLQVLNHDIALGWFIRALHGWGSNFMVGIVLIHMVQVFLFGAYKYPRELTWMVGVLLLLVTLGMAFTGQVLRFDQDAYWGLGIGASIVSRVPMIGPTAVNLLLGGPIIAGATLSRFFALHVFVIPGLLIGFVCLHLLLVLKLGINEWPMPGRIVRRATYVQEYHELTHTNGVPFVPYAVWKDILFSGFILLSIAVCAAFFGPFGPSGQPDPTIIQTAPRPDFFFLWLYAVLSFLPPAAETPLLLTAPVVGIALLLLLPFFAGEGEKSWKRRPIAVLVVLLIAVSLGTLHAVGTAYTLEPGDGRVEQHADPSRVSRTGVQPWSGKAPSCSRRSSAATAIRSTAKAASADRRSTRWRCASRRDQLVRQVIQGGGNMPAYGKNLSPAETNAAVAFLATLHPKGQAPARDAALDLTPPP